MALFLVFFPVIIYEDFLFVNSIIVDNVIFRCIHPNKEYTSLLGTENSYSEVFLMSYKKFDMLFTGDLEADVCEFPDRPVRRLKAKLVIED